MLPLPEEDASVLELSSQTLLDGGSWGDFECLAVCWSMGSISVCELVKTVTNFLGEGLSGERSLQVDQVNETGGRRDKKETDEPRRVFNTSDISGRK